MTTVKQAAAPTARPIPAAATTAWRLPWAIMLLLAGVYLLTMSGHTYSPDEETMYEVTRRIALHGDVAVVVEDGAPVAALRRGADGRMYSPYGILPSLLALPLFAVGSLAAPLGPAAFEYGTRLAVSTLNGFVTAATAALLAAWALRLGIRRRAALALALLYGLCTFAWPYARTFFSEPLAALLLLAAAERADAARLSARPARALLLSGLAAGLLLTTRIASGIALPVLALFILLTSTTDHRPPTLDPSRGWKIEDRGSRLRSIRTAILNLQSSIFSRQSSVVSRQSSVVGLGLWCLGLLPGLVLLASYNMLRFGTPLATGYASEAGAFTTPIATGLYGLLLSPGKSLFLFAPPVLLALPGALRLWPAHRAIVLLALGLFIAHLLLYAGWVAWNGGGVWGPRFLLPAVPLLMLLASGYLSAENKEQRTKHKELRAENYPDGTRPRTENREPRAESREPRAENQRQSSIFYPLSSILALGLGGLGLVGTLGGVLLNFDTYQNMPVSEQQRQYTIAGSPLVAHWRLLGERMERYFAGSPSCALGDGLFPPEGTPGEALPRRTGTLGRLRCHVAAPALLALKIDDRRPPGAPPSNLRLRAGDYDAGPQPADQARVYTLLLPPGHTTLALAASPWNPLEIGFSERNDNLGVLIETVRLAPLDGTPARLIDTAIAPLPERARARWAWYYDPSNQHFADHWAWYLPRSELPGWVEALIAVVLCGGALAALLAGAALLRGAE